jgi:hypothetical protein
MEQSPYTWIIAIVIIIGKLLLDRLAGQANDDEAPGDKERRPPVSPVDPFPNEMPRDRGNRIETEEEARLRRFREALGLPPEAEMPQPRRVPQKPVEQEETPVFEATPPPLPEPVAPVPAPIFREFPKPATPPPWGESADPAPEPTRRQHPQAREHHHNDEESLIPRFEDGASLVNVPDARPIEYSAPQMELDHGMSAPPPHGHSTATANTHEVSAAKGLRLDLQDPAALKRAFVLKEVLGAPKALQGV